MAGSIADRKRRWNDFFSGRRRKILLVHLWGDDAPPPRPWPHPDNIQERVDWSLAVYRRQRDLAGWLDDDAIPFLDPFSGTEVFAEAFGCPVHRPGTTMPFALPLVRQVGDLRRLRAPKVEESSLAAIFDIADRLRAAEPLALMRLPDIQSPFDIAALVWEKAEFFAALHEEPEAAREMVALAEDLLTRFLDLWYARYGSEFVAHFPAYYMAKGVTLSEDEAGSISPAMFGDFSKPAIDRLAARFGPLGVHCCARAEHQWRHFKDFRGLSLLNLVTADDAVTRATTFFGDSCAHMHYPMGGGAEPPPNLRRVREVHCGNREEAKKACERRAETETGGT